MQAGFRVAGRAWCPGGWVGVIGYEMGHRPSAVPPHGRDAMGNSGRRRLASRAGLERCSSETLQGRGRTVPMLHVGPSSGSLSGMHARVRMRGACDSAGRAFSWVVCRVCWVLNLLVCPLGCK